MLKILILICPLAIDHAHCNRDTATDVVSSMRVSTPQQCGFMGQAMLAPTALVPDPSREYMKIMCIRTATVTALADQPH